jgi:hypothetical protein
VLQVFDERFHGRRTAPTEGLDGKGEEMFRGLLNRPATGATARRGL